MFYQSETYLVDFLMVITKEKTFLIWINLNFVILFVLLCFMLLLCSMKSLPFQICKDFPLCLLLRVFTFFNFIFNSLIHFKLTFLYMVALIFYCCYNKISHMLWLEQYKFIILKFWMSEIWHGSHWVETKVLEDCIPFWML